MIYDREWREWNNEKVWDKIRKIKDETSKKIFLTLDSQ